MAGNPVKYAEDTLGVHTVWEESQQRMARLESVMGERTDALSKVRNLRTKIADREADLTAESPSRWPDANATERGRLLKADIQKDARLQDMRSEVDDLQATLDMLDGEIRQHESGLRVLAARMEQLGGLLTFYAARK